MNGVDYFELGLYMVLRVVIMNGLPVICVV